VHGRKIPVADMCDRIDMVTASDIRRLSHRIFGESCVKPSSIVVQGEEDVQDAESVLRKYGVGGSSL
jgi:mitochondrial-processing peptidase subunit alpha